MRSFNDAMGIAEYHRKVFFFYPISSKSFALYIQFLFTVMYTICLLKENEKILLKNRRRKNIFIALS